MVNIRNAWRLARGQFPRRSPSMQAVRRCSLCGWREVLWDNEMLIHVLDPSYEVPKDFVPIRLVCKHHQTSLGGRATDCLTGLFVSLSPDIPKWRIWTHEAWYWIRVLWRFPKATLQESHWSIKKWLEQKTQHRIFP